MFPKSNASECFVHRFKNDRAPSSAELVHRTSDDEMKKMIFQTINEKKGEMLDNLRETFSNLGESDDSKNQLTKEYDNETYVEDLFSQIF